MSPLEEYRQLLQQEIASLDAALAMERAMSAGIESLRIQLFVKGGGETPAAYLELRPGGDMAGMLAVISANLSRMRKRFADALELFQGGS